MRIWSIVLIVLMICTFVPSTVTVEAQNSLTLTYDQAPEWVYHDVYGQMPWGKTSLALDDQGKEHIAFWDTTLNDLIYTTNAGGSRTSTVVDHSWNTTGEAVIEIDGSGRPHLVYTVMGDPGTTTAILRHAVLIEGIWNVTDIAIGNISWGLDMALDLNDNVHICYLEYRSWDLADLVYCNNEDGSWIKTVVGAAYVPTVSIAVDHRGKAYISYMAAPDNVLGLATNSNGTWDNVIIDSVPTYIGTFSSIAIDPFGKVHISYVDYNPDGELKYATNSTGSWACEYVDSQANINSPTSMALDSEQRAHIAYYDWFHADLKYATNANGSWTISTVASAGETGHGPCLALDANDMPHISYVDSSQSTVRCAVLTLPHPVPRYQVDVPARGETWRCDATYRIQWKSASTSPTVRLDLCLPGMQPEGGVGPVSVLIIDEVANNSGYYDWTIPDLMPGNAYRIEVSDANDNTTFAYSSDFDIKGPKQPDVTGVVCTELDYPVAGAQVLIDGLSTVTCDQNGHFITELSQGEHDLTFSATGFDPLSIRITVGNVTLLDLGTIHLTVNNSAMHLVIYHHGTDFSLLIPETWELAQDISIGGGNFALVLNGSASGMVRTNINIQMVLDPSAQGTTSYLWKLANDTIHELIDHGYSVSIFENPKFLTISNRSAMIYSIRYEDNNLVQEQAFVIDDDSHRGWIITFTTTQAEYPGYKPMFDQIASSLQISDSASSNTGIDMVSLMTLIGVMAGLVVLAISFRIRGRAGIKR
jgi:hypothetical protein